VGGLRCLGREEAFFGEFVHEAADELDGGQERICYRAFDSSLCQGVNDFVESDEDGELICQGWKNNGFVARFLLDWAGSALWVVVTTERGAVNGWRVAWFAVAEGPTALRGHEFLLGLRVSDERTVDSRQ
jgi:hypothetical protein